MANAYAAHLGGRDPLEVIGQTADQLRRVIKTLGPARSEESAAPGKWGARQIVCHLADCEITWAFRIRQTLAQDNHVVQPFDQDLWARTYQAYDVERALATFTALRGWNIALLESLPAEAAAKPLRHPERGDMTLR